MLHPGGWPLLWGEIPTYGPQISLGRCREPFRLCSFVQLIRSMRIQIHFSTLSQGFEDISSLAGLYTPSPKTEYSRKGYRTRPPTQPFYCQHSQEPPGKQQRMHRPKHWAPVTSTATPHSNPQPNYFFWCNWCTFIDATSASPLSFLKATSRNLPATGEP